MILKISDKNSKDGFEFPINYGHTEEILALNNEYLDAYILGIDEPIDKFTGVVIAIIHHKNDIVDKLVVAPEGKKYTNQEILDLVSFQEKYFDIEIIR